LQDTNPDDQNSMLLIINEILERRKIAVPPEIQTSMTKMTDFLNLGLHPQLARKLAIVLAQLQHTYCFFHLSFLGSMISL
jgi:hypothetical protein